MEHDFHCTDCGHEFNQTFWDRNLPPICPECSSRNIISMALAEENKRLNAQEAEAESWKEEL